MKAEEIYCKTKLRIESAPAHKGSKKLVMGGRDLFRTLQVCFFSTVRMTSHVNYVGLGKARDREKNSQNLVFFTIWLQKQDISAKLPLHFVQPWLRAESTD